MKALVLLGLLLVLAYPYAVEGNWQSTQYPDARIAVSPLMTGQDGLNQYKITVDGCPSEYQFKIIESFIKMTNPLPNSNSICSSTNASALHKELQQKILYFDIKSDQLILVTVSGSKTIQFQRVVQSTVNKDLQGQFRTSENVPVWIGPNKVYLCDGSLNANYTTDSVTSFQVNQSTLQDNCNLSIAQNKQVYDSISKGEHYRIESPYDLILYSRNKRQARLKYFGPFKASDVVVTVPVNTVPVNSQQSNNDSVVVPVNNGSSTVQQNQTQTQNQKNTSLNQSNVPQNQTNSSQLSQQNQSSQNQNQQTTHNQSQNQQNQSQQSQPSTTTTQNNQVVNVNPQQSSASTSTSSNTQSSQQNQGQNNQSAQPKELSVPVQKNQSTSQTQKNDSAQTTSSTPASSNQGSAPSSPQTPIPSSQTTQPTNTQNTSAPSNPPQQQQNQNQQSQSVPNTQTAPPSPPSQQQPVPAPSTPAAQPAQQTKPTSSSRPFVIQPVNLIGTWLNDYFAHPNPSLWPPRTIFNGTNILFQGCNTVSLPWKIDTSLNTVTALPANAMPLTRRACGNSDQQFIDIIGRSSRVEPVANGSHLVLTFYDGNNQKTFVAARQMADNQGNSLVYVQTGATNRGNQGTQSGQSQNQGNNNQQSTQQNLQISTTTSQQTTQNQQPTVTPPTAQSQQQQQQPQPQTQQPPQTPQTQSLPPAEPQVVIPPVQPQATTPPPAKANSLTATQVQKAIVGIYNPKMIHSLTLPPPLASTIIFIFTLDSVSILGLCKTYKYPMTITQNNNFVEVSVDPKNRLERPNKAGCDPIDDRLYLDALQSAKTISMINQNGQIQAFFFNKDNNQILMLVKQQL